MTLSAYAEKFGDRLPSTDEKAAANHLRQIIASNMDDGAVLQLLDNEKKPAEITLSPAISDLLLELLRHIGNGDAVTLVPVSQELTTQQAADILNVSRPYLIKLLEEDTIAYSLVGRHRRIKAEDLFAYKKQRDSKRSNALAELAELDADII